MHRNCKNLYEFTKKISKCDVTIKSTITKRTISRKRKVVGTITKKIHQKRNKIGEKDKVLTFLSWTTWKEQERERLRINLYEN